jgi:2'-5' RNA ligase
LLAEIPEDNEEKVISIATTLANQLQSFTIILDAVGMEETFFRALYKAVIPSDELSEAHAKALQAFGMKDAFPYMPHLSLFYGNTSAETKTKMAQSLELPEDLSFVVNKIHVYRTHGSATEWVEVAALDLQ